VFDFKYQTAGVLGEDFFTGPNFSYNTSGTPTVFSTPGAPFGIWIGVRYDFGRPTNQRTRLSPTDRGEGRRSQGEHQRSQACVQR